LIKHINQFSITVKIRFFNRNIAPDEFQKLSGNKKALPDYPAKSNTFPTDVIQNFQK